MAVAAEEEVLLEVEAVESVYGDDCRVVCRFPPHLHVLIRPRTADDSSQQFVEVVLGIQLGDKYPSEPPCLNIVEFKGLDVKRQTHLIHSLQDKAQDLSSCQMLVALCENCSLTLSKGIVEAYMAPSSESECIIRWWSWLQEQNETRVENGRDTSVSLGSSDVSDIIKQPVGNCPVCRKVFHAEDIRHVLDLLDTDHSQLTLEATDLDSDAEEILHNERENERREIFAAFLKKQEENSGLFEPNKTVELMPGIFLHESTPLVTASTTESACEQSENSTGNSVTQSNSSQKPNASDHRNSNTRRRNRAHPPRRKDVNSQSSRRQWIRREVNAPE
ncbi:hypothetical protein QJS04_geneDACA012515 [Acorus gramineus]|uniref:RWD domain-containing protein n=1 Tax=Acorus gramineus TaxID=55184 RepID=A0AAV9BCR8_ACOGR|nr:hypothetical protein QJS04_geneDACA012515 [Acorus gramineus]